MFTRWHLRRGDVNVVIYAADAAREGQYGFTGGPIWVHVSRLLSLSHTEHMAYTVGHPY